MKMYLSGCGCGVLNAWRIPFYVSGSCFTTLAVILVSDCFFLPKSFYNYLGCLRGIIMIRGNIAEPAV